MSVKFRYLSRDPIDLDIVPHWFTHRMTPTMIFVLGAKILLRLREIEEAHLLEHHEGTPGNPGWLIGRSSGFTVDLRQPQVRLRFLLTTDDVTDEIEQARQALVKELDAMDPSGCRFDGLYGAMRLAKAMRNERRVAEIEAELDELRKTTV